MKLSPALLALALLPLIAPLPTHAQDKAPDKTDKTDKTEKPSAPAAPGDRDVHSYRLLYTLTEIEAGKKVGEQHFTMLVNPGGRQSLIRIGSKVPVATGSGAAIGVQTQFTYMDVGLTINASVNVVPNGIQISSGVDQSSLGEVTSSVSGQPIIRNTSLSSNVTLTPGAHIQIGSLDIPGSTHHSDIDLTLERVN